MNEETKPAARKRVLARLENVAVLPLLTPAQMVQAAINAGQWEAVDKLLELQERVEKRNALKAYNDAIAIAKSRIQPIIKDKHVGFEAKQPGGRRTDYWYEDLATIAKHIDPILSDAGLSYRFRTHSPPNEPVTVTCMIAHRDGHSEENSLSGPRDESGNKNPIQAIGSIVTYLQRYTLKASLGLSAERDDDALRAGTAPPTIINDEQYEQLQRMIVEVAQDLGKFCAHYNIEKVRDLPADKFDGAIATLKRKRDREQGKDKHEPAAEHP